ncbi:transposon Ty3-I Gag-Pol polyprotein [Trichonephila clavipes]|nr:transposon Ty3-I Gag-Pol polyprotein [Trichonephila clavipes]
MAKIATLEIASLKLQRKVRSSSPHHHQGVESQQIKAPLQSSGTILLLPFPIREEVSPCKPNLVNRKHEVKHHILTTGQPVYSKARQLAPDKLKLAKQEFQFMLDNDIIRPSKSQWASPLHFNKKDGTLRPCGDYRRLNAQTIRYQFRIEDFNHILKDKKIFSR